MLKSKIKILPVLVFLILRQSSFPQELKDDGIHYDQKMYKLYPETYINLTGISSPFKTDDGHEILIALTGGNRQTLINVTVENGSPMDYTKNQWNKGDQLKSDEADFPTLAKTGIHSEVELDMTRTITGKSIAEITEWGRPERSSGAGFMAEDEDIVSVLKGDNNLVKKLGLTHPELAKPLFHIFNMMLLHREIYSKKIRPYEDIDYILYNGRKISIQWGGAKGWQNSIFDDEILGYYQINIQIELNEEEQSYLNSKYSNLSSRQKSDLIEKLTNIHTGEMVPYYIQRYGFYEGHTGYRADPIAVSFIFGLRTLKEIEAAFQGKLYNVLTEHFR